jgi:hypothetical protein
MTALAVDDRPPMQGGALPPVFSQLTSPKQQTFFFSNFSVVFISLFARARAVQLCMDAAVRV